MFVKTLVLIAALLAPLPSVAQESSSPSPSRPGPVAQNGPAIDPTENVKALTEAAVKRLDDLKSAATQREDDLRAAETRRINELAAQKQLFDLELARVLKGNVDSSALLLSTQLKEVKTDLSDRVAKLEQFRWESGGKTSVTDPATAEALTKMAAAISAITIASSKIEGVGAGRTDILGWIGFAVMAFIAIAAIFVPLMMRRPAS